MFGIISTILAITIKTARGGFDQYGYNYQARIFVGPFDDVNRMLEGKVREIQLMKKELNL